MKTEVLLHCKGTMYRPMRAAMVKARGTNIIMTQTMDNDTELYLKIPISEAGAWVTLLDSMADAADADDDEALMYDDLANTIAEEAEKILGTIKQEEKVPSEMGRDKARNFWKGI